MGQSESSVTQHTLSAEELSKQLAEQFATKCFSHIEMVSFKDNFRALADTQDGVRYWKEETLTQFLELPDVAGIRSIIFQMTSNLGAFPFESKGPAILNFEALVKAVALVTGRSAKVLKQDNHLRILFRSLAVREKKPNVEPNDDKALDGVAEYDSEDDDEEDLVLDELKVLDGADDLAKERSSYSLHIPIDHLRHLLRFLLAIPSLQQTESLSLYADRFTDPSIITTAECLLRCFPTVESGIKYRSFSTTVRKLMPHLFSQGLPQLFLHFLYSKNYTAVRSPTAQSPTSLSPIPIEEPQPIILKPSELMTPTLLSQLSLFISSDRLFRRVRPLYLGSSDGFSMGAFETKVINWRAPTILLVSGQRISEPPTNRERSFTERLPLQRYASGSDPEGDGKLIFGAFLQSPWKISHKDCFGDSQTILFQLHPVMRIWKAGGGGSKEFAYFNRDDGVGFGAPVQDWKNTRRQSPYFYTGAVSLVLDNGLEWGVMTAIGDGGAFRMDGGEKMQERFEVLDLEVWGCGGEKEAEEQLKAWQWEEREALLRRQVNLGKDIEADRALLEMAGLIGQNQSGGSMN
ncbi:TLD-domain-containing protein [Pyronema omphalodes]|nr:TLD-domain-containing protein [Pyronema omphalodes]